ncbi:MAG: HNH endonuclease signature motif containing protein [Acidobacteriota bacterium]
MAAFSSKSDFFRTELDSHSIRLQSRDSNGQELRHGKRDWFDAVERGDGTVQRGSSPTPGSPAEQLGWGGTVRGASVPGPATISALESSRFGKPVLVTPRLGQGSFRILVADSYNRRCTMTGERTFPALEAAHIHRYSRGGDHTLSNGLLLRSDPHKLFDLGYLTIDPSTLKIRVSGKIREEFENGRDYYRLDDQPSRQPEKPACHP